MCMYYNPNKVFGPTCLNPQNVTMTTDIAGHLLDVVNTIRSKLAKNTETGMDRRYLPRGYGMFRLKWDTELATYAQVLANQCLLSHDLCRSTKKFPDPSQTTGVLRFSFPDWNILYREQKHPRGLTKKKIDHAVDDIISTWYYGKKYVDASMIQYHPDLGT